MYSVPFKFTPPDAEDLTKLHIYEAATRGGPFTTLIETVEPVGVYPAYIDNYTTDQATSPVDWFAIQWEDSKGAKSAMSPSIQGGTETLVSEVIDRVMQRDPFVSRAVVAQEVEASVEMFFGKDPYTATDADIPAGRKYRTINGLTYLSLARVYLAGSTSSSEVTSATLGLVSFKSSTGQERKVDVQSLLDLAGIELGIGQSRVLQIATCDTQVWVNVLEP